MDELSKLYSPSQWTKRLSPKEVIPYHFKFIETETNKLSKQIKIDEDRPYGDTERTKIDIIGTDLTNDAPILVFVHGGYWQIKSITRKSYRFIAKNLHKHNIKTILIGYDLCPDISLEEIVKQIEQAIRKCLEYAQNHKTKSLYLAGHSAGAHLITNLFRNFVETLNDDQRELIKAAFIISGIFDLVPIQKTVINVPLKLTETEAFNLSPYHGSISKQIKTKYYIIVGAYESPEFIRQSKEFHEKLVEEGFESVLIVVPEVDHFDIIENLADDDYELMKQILAVIN